MQKRIKTVLIVSAILLTVFLSLRLYLIYLMPDFFCDYIEYNGVKYYPANDYSIKDEFDIPTHVYSSLDDGDFKLKVKLYKSNGIRVGTLLNFYAENFYGFDAGDIPLLIFDSALYVNDYELANREPIEKWLDTAER
ncbi:MAG: hypothetical protein IJA55_05045 [Clostridia bacterium]|nr:hypothetical protein [Clostridia bacterium]